MNTSDVTVIVPTLQDAAGTLERCLDSVHEHAAGAGLIVNGRTARRPYAENCNLGAKVASEELLLFLNDDATLRAGAVDAMAAAFDDPNVGIVGARLVYPTGDLQHAGVFLTVAGGKIVEGHHYQEERPSGPVLAVTGAALMVRRQLFEALGGFDTAYYNGNEDVDLCLQAVQAGWTVWYCAEATIEHRESASGPERWARVTENIRLLSERWAPVLAGG